MHKNTQYFWLDKILALAIEMYELATPSHVQYTFNDVIDMYGDNVPIEHLFEAIPIDCMKIIKIMLGLKYMEQLEKC